MAKRRPDITVEWVREHLHYDPETGLFTWIKNQPRGKKMAGKPAGSANSHGYIQIFIHGRSVRAHRLAVFHMTGEWPDADVDHRNNNKGDNSWENIRPATRQQNSHNIGLRRDSTSGVRGVSWHKRERKWQAYISDPATKRRKCLGFFRDKEDAVRVRAEAEVSLFGEFRFAKAA